MRSRCLDQNVIGRTPLRGRRSHSDGAFNADRSETEIQNPKIEF